MTEAQRNLGFTIQIDNAGIFHFVIQIVPFTGTFTNAREHRHTTVCFRDVVDQFLNGHGFTHTGTTEQTNLTTLQIWAQQVNNLNTRYQLLGFGGLVNEQRRVAVNGVTFFGLRCWHIVNRVTDHVQNTTQCFRANRNGDRFTRIQNFCAANQTICGVHGDATHGVFTQMLRYFQNQCLAIILRGQRVQNGWYIALFELYVQNSAQDLCDRSFCLCHRFAFTFTRV